MSRYLNFAITDDHKTIVGVIRSTLVAVALIVSASHADGAPAPEEAVAELENQLDKALATYNGKVASIVTVILKELKQRLTESLDRGDLEAAKSLQSAIDAIEKDGTLPKGEEFRRLLEGAGRSYTVAVARFCDECDVVVRAYTKMRMLDRAESVAGEAKALQQIEPLSSGVLRPQDRKALRALAVRKPDVGRQAQAPVINPNAKEVRLALRHQSEEPGLCSVTCASIALDYFGTQIPPRALKVMSRGRDFNPNEPFNDFTGTMFRDLCGAVGRAGHAWTQQHFANDVNGFGIGLQQIKIAIDAGRPVLIDLTNAFGQDGSHVFIVCGYSDRTGTAFILDPHAQAPGIRDIGYAQLALVWNSLGVRGNPFNGRGIVITSGKNGAAR